MADWRGINFPGLHLKAGETVPTAIVPDRTLAVLYRQRKITFAAAAVAPQPAPSPQPSARESLAARLRELGKSELRALCQSKGIDASGNEAHLRNRLLAMVG